MMSRYAAFVFFLSFGVVSHLSHGIEVEVKNKDKLCLYASLTLNFSVTYEVADNKNKTVSFELPANASSDGSKCDDTNSILKLSFPDGHSWSVDFSLKDESYQADTMTFVYNLNDSKVFPDSSSNETITVKTKPDITDVGMNTSYSCKSKDTLVASLRANMTLSDVLIQAFIVSGNRSKNLTTCRADEPVTPTPTHVTNATTVAPATNATTVAPATNATTVAPPTTPTPTLPTPTVGNYSIRHDANSTACLLANFGLRIGFTQNKKYQEVNFDPPTEVSGSCGADNSELILVSNNIAVSLSFYNDTNKFRLHAVNVTINSSSGVFAQSGANLSLWEAAVGSSYMCNKEQNFTITSLLSFYTFSLHVQPFAVKNGIYSTAHECSLDDSSILIPIIVGAALAGLILIVVIAYVIGRRKTHVGYQTL
ncbi:lysosome-associated membrane glycoprotein 2 isoform X3 [Poecilia reticulata]|uniref:lysosome-associated membrane glycoprotein 2 isoform X3 n=1 Tax=Poecilia reticulata TaxID=8081 RepID=UPI0004A353C9|nr:PREDICTED: lysosome-associated membrane glycoprotein 2 isoform X3 [Poecilia reticulata]